MGLAQPKAKPSYTEEEYLAFERAAEERHEYLDGAIYAMAGESPNHGTISTNLVAIVVTQLRGKDCRAFTKDMKVRSGPLPRNRLNTKGLFSYPDLVVVCGEMKFLDEHRDVLTNPTVIIEVLSEATEKFDRNRKFLRYQKYLPPLTDYVLVSQDQPLIELFHRDSPEWWNYTSVSELKGRLRIPSIKCDLRLAEVYDRISFPTTNVDKGESSATHPRPARKKKSKGRPARSQAPASSAKRKK
jgi:Uma2 family endonuclease